MSPVWHLNPDNLYQIPTTTNVIVVTGGHKTIYTGAIGAMDADGAVVGVGDIEAQARQVLKNMEIALASANAKLEHVVRWNVQIVQGQRLGPAFEAFVSTWGSRSNYPTISVSFVSALVRPDMLVQMDAIAVVPDEIRMTQSIPRPGI